MFNKYCTNHIDTSLFLPYSTPNISTLFSKKIVSWFSPLPREYVVVCVGTDRSTGDSLGPLVGTLLTNMNLRHITVYGTLHKPIHGRNLNTYIEKINLLHRNPFIIAIDACLGKSSSVGNVIVSREPLKPGTALGKELPTIGDLTIKAVVNIGGYMEYSVLQNTRLSFIVDLAKCISGILSLVDQKLTYQRPQAAIVSRETI